MTAPRRIVRNATYLLTRRCSERRLFLRPSKETNGLVLYLLAVAAERFGILVHAYCFLSNHFHMVVTDPLGGLPAFEQYLASLIARACNALHGRWESFWAPGSYSAVTLPGLEDVIDKMAYTLANPVAAGLVRRGDEWPGVRSSVDAIGGGAIRVRRPEHFFRADGPMPETASLRIVAPPGVESLEGFRSQVKSAVVEQEEQAARKVAAKGRGFIGVRRVLAQSPFSRPTGNEVHRELSPRVAGRDRWKRIEAIGRLKEFLRDHREAWREFASGVRDVVFPHGTYWMRVMYAVPCASAG